MGGNVMECWNGKYMLWKGKWLEDLDFSDDE